MKRIAALLVLVGICAGMDCEGNMSGAMPASDPVITDTDGDGLTDAEEALLLTNPLLSDTDGDGLFDLEEILIGTNPVVQDTDGDGLSDGDELLLLDTDPLNPDTDFDGLSDGDEVLVIGTDPLNVDTDLDGLTDGLELDPTFGSDPLDPDTDDDGFLDGEEIALGLDLLSPNPIGIVSEVFCADFIAVSGVVGGVIGVYDDFGGFGGFLLGFLPGQLVALGAEGIEGDLTGQIRVNLTTGETGFFPWLGELSVLGGTIVDVEPTAISIRIILSNGLGFEVNFLDVPETNDWFLGDSVEIILPRDPSDPLSSSRMLNVDACEAVLLSL